MYPCFSDLSATKHDEQKFWLSVSLKNRMMLKTYKQNKSLKNLHANLHFLKVNLEPIKYIIKLGFLITT